MRRSACLLLLLAAQWHHFADGQPVSAPSSLEREMLAAHNSVRSRLRLAPLSWSARLAATAQAWADTLIARKQFYHRPNSSLGENLFEMRGAAASASQVVEAWAGESKDYDYQSNKCRGVCGHYTQVVWRTTREVGCAVGRDRRREVWVCEYDPPGNWVGQRPY